MKIIFMGTPDFALKTLTALEKEFGVGLVITQPDKPSGRKKEIVYSPVKQFCLDKKINFLQPAKLKENEILLKNINDFAPDLICVAAYGKILTKEILEAPKIACINIHASILPKYRGAAPINRAIIDGVEETGVTIMDMDLGMDTGDIISIEKIKIENSDTTESLTNKLSNLGSKQIVKFINKLKIDPIYKSVCQNHGESTLAPKMNQADGIIDWTKSANEIFNLIRGCSPWPIAHTRIKDKIIKIHKATLDDSPKLSPGAIKNVEGNMIVGCKDRNLKIIEIQKSGQKKISAKDFLNGISNMSEPVFR
mgnify:CR=1 FL=1